MGEPAAGRTGPEQPTVVVAARGAARWRAGHPWIYRSDVVAEQEKAQEQGAGIVRVTDRRGRFLGQALYSPRSEIRLRLLTKRDEPVDAAWWRARLGAALERRRGIEASAYRVVNGEGDGLPSLIVDRYGGYVVAQLLSAGLEAARAEVVDAIAATLAPTGILLRHDAPVRRHEGLPLGAELALGDVPRTPVEVDEHGVRFSASLWDGQKTGAFLDQRENRVLVGRMARGRTLDVFTYHGSFALHLARAADSVLAVDQSVEALERGKRNAELNGLTNIAWREANAFDLLRELERRDERFDVVVLDPPAFAKTKTSVPRALAGYKEINLRAMRILNSGGLLFTCSCSYHVHRGAFLDMLAAAGQDSGRHLQLLEIRGAASDHPELLTVPETGYLKGVLLRAVD